MGSRGLRDALGGVVIFYGTLPIDDSTPREQRIEAAEDRADQVAFDLMREAR